MIFSYPLPFCYSGYDQLVMELITSQVEEAAGSRLSRVGREILSAHLHRDPKQQRDGGATSGEDDGETAGGGARPLLRSWRARLLFGGTASSPRAARPDGGGASPALAHKPMSGRRGRQTSSLPSPGF
jgi:hypothetical protein